MESLTAIIEAEPGQFELIEYDEYMSRHEAHNEQWITEEEQDLETSELVAPIAAA